MIVLRIKKGNWGLRESHRLEQLPAVVGRSPACDVWIDHPQLSKEQARIERRGDGFAVVNLSERTPLRVSRRSVPEVIFTDKCAFKCGEVSFEVVAGMANLEHTQETLLPSFASPWRDAGIISAWIVMASLARALLTPVENNVWWVDFLAWMILPLPLIVAGCALPVALWTKLQSGKYRYPEALRITAKWAAINILFFAFAGTLVFNWPHRPTQGLLFQWLPVFYFLAITLQIAWFVFRNFQRKWVTAVVVGLYLFFGLSYLLFEVIKPSGSNLDFNAPIGYPLSEFNVGDMRRLEEGFRGAVRTLESRRARELATYEEGQRVEAEAAKQIGRRNQPGKTVP